MTDRQRVWTFDEVKALGVRTTVPIAGEIIAGLCKDESYRAVQRGTFPVPVSKSAATRRSCRADPASYSGSAQP